MKNLLKFQETMITQKKTYQSTHIIKAITNTSILQQINSTGKLEQGDGTSMFFIIGKQQKNFSLDSLNVTE